MMVDLAVHLDELRLAAGRVVALSAVAVENFDNLSTQDPDPDVVERVAHLPGAAYETAAAMLESVDRFRGIVADMQPAASGERWDDAGPGDSTPTP